MKRCGIALWDLRIKWPVLGVDAIVHGPSLCHSCPSCTKLKALCTIVQTLLASIVWRTESVPYFSVAAGKCVPSLRFGKNLKPVERPANLVKNGLRLHGE